MELDKLLVKLDCRDVVENTILKCPYDRNYLIILPYIKEVKIMETSRDDYLTITDDGLIAIQRGLDRIPVICLDMVEDVFYGKLEDNPFIFDSEKDLMERKKQEILYLKNKGYGFKEIRKELDDVSDYMIRKVLKS